MIRTAALIFLISSAAGAVFAAGPAPAPVVAAPTPPPAVVAPFWEGAYVGGQLGYSFSEFDVDTGAGPGDLDDDQFIGGITAGYLFSLNNGYYVGPEFQYDFADLSVTDAASGDTATFDEIARLKLIGGREIGNGLLYGTIGVAFASFDSVGTVLDGFDGDDTSFALGFGYDHRVADNFTIGAEYIYHEFNGVGDSGNDVNLNAIYVKGAYRF